MMQPVPVVYALKITALVLFPPAALSLKPLVIVVKDMLALVEDLSIF